MSLARVYQSLRAGELDVTEYLKKPLDFDRLYGLVRKYGRESAGS